MPNRALLRALAASFLAGEADAAQVVARGTHTLGRRPRWLAPVAERFVAAFGGQIRPRHRDVVRFLRHEIDLAQPLSDKRWLNPPPQMQPVAAAASWDLPAIVTVGDMADWLGLTPGELDWFADLKALGSKRNSPRLRHYHYRVLSKGHGCIRLIEAPKSTLKILQQRILARILEKIPVHPAVHGFVKERSIKTFIAPHVGRRVVLRLDLRDFFPSFSGARIQALFRTIGYPERVADLLGGICTNAAPRDIWKGCPYDVRILYARPHLPQGAPTSPALANLCTYRADCRLTGLARSAGAAYTRYADDLAFSGDEEFERRVERFSTHAAAILHEEGFAVNHRKTRIMRQGVRQHLAGLVANQRVNVIRADFDRLKATLTNCVRNGPESQNRDGHPAFRAYLEGRLGFVESIHPARGKRLRAIFERIRWDGA